MLEPVKKVRRIAMDNFRDVPEERLDILDHMQRTIGRSGLYTSLFRQARSDVQTSLNVLVNSGLDDATEFVVIERGSIFFDQTAKFVEQKVVALHAIVEVFKWILWHQ